MRWLALKTMKKAFTLLSLALLFSLTLVSAYSNWDDRYNWNREYYTISTRDYHQYNSPRYIDYDRPYYVYQQKGFYTDTAREIDREMGNGQLAGLELTLEFWKKSDELLRQGNLNEIEIIKKLKGVLNIEDEC